MRLRSLLILTLMAAVATGAAANGPAWVAELSATQPAHSETLTVTIPAGSHAAVAVYNTDAVEPQCPAGVAATVRVMWYEHRTVYADMPGERVEAIPYYLPEPKDCRPTGSWVVELTPAALGTYTVPIACNSNTVTVTLRVVRVRPAQEPAYLRDMAAHGMNTFTPYAREVGPSPWDYAECLRYHIDTAIEQGLVDTRFPLLCLSTGYADLARAQTLARHDWPELVGYNCDEPGVDRAAEVADCAAGWHAVGARTGTAIDGLVAQQIGAPLDIWVMHMDSLTPERIAGCRAAGKEFWTYNCALRGSNAAQHRYWTGVYTWAVGSRVALTWTYMHDAASRILPDGTWNLQRVYDTATCDGAGKPVPTVALEGLQEGIIDSRFLQALERRGTPEGRAYLRHLRAQVWRQLGFWTDGKGRDSSTYVWDVPDTQVPPVDCVAVRQEVLRLLGVSGDGDPVSPNAQR
jgi:hypothetical protein